jgi:hypothetical protein
MDPVSGAAADAGTLLSFAAFPCCFPLFAKIIAGRRQQNSSLVFWLRGFRAGPLRAPGFPPVLRSACAGLSTPVTLQNDQYALSSEVGFYRNFAFHVTIFVAPLILGLLLCIPLYFLLRDVSAGALAITGLVLGPGLGIALGLLMKWRQRRTGIFRLTGENADTELAALLRKLAGARKWSPGVAGVAVITVPAAHWRSAVLKTLEQSVLVVIEVTDLTENLAWELAAAMMKLPPERIVIASAVKAQHSEESYREAIRQRIGNVAGQELAPRFPLFLYPESVDRSRLFLPRMKPGRTLQSLIQQRVSDKPLTAPSS